MAEQTYIYWAFPECASVQDKVTYVHIQKEVTKDDVVNVVKTIYQFYQDFVHEQMCSYYDSDNVERFLHDVTVSKRVYPSSQKMRSAFKDNKVMNCRKMKGRSQTMMTYPFPFNVQNTLMEAIANGFSSAEEHGSAVLILNINGIESDPNLLKLDNGNGELTIDVKTMNRDELYNWFVENRRPARIWLWNSKHGDKYRAQQNNPGEKVSRLLSTQDEAKDNLPKAISVAVVDSKNGDMYMFDAQYDAYIDFKASNGTWHAFHLGDEDERKKITPELLKRLKLFGLERK